MIKDNISNAHLYFKLSTSLEKGLQWLQNTDLLNIDDGKYNIDGDRVFANVQTYLTKEDAKYESHKKYIDIQYLIKGIEKVGVTDVSNCKSCIKYDSEKDLEFYEIDNEDEYIKLEENNFIILYPHDAHKPSIAVDSSILVKKVVVKVLYD